MEERVKDEKLTIFFPRPVGTRNNAVRDTPDELEHSSGGRKEGVGNANRDPTLMQIYLYLATFLF